MATIHGRLRFAVRIKVNSLVVPDKAMTDMAMKWLEGKVTPVLEAAVRTVELIPGFSFAISEAGTKIEVEKIDP